MANFSIGDKVAIHYLVGTIQGTVVDTYAKNGKITGYLVADDSGDTRWIETDRVRKSNWMNRLMSSHQNNMWKRFGFATNGQYETQVQRDEPRDFRKPPTQPEWQPTNDESWKTYVKSCKN